MPFDPEATGIIPRLDLEAAKTPPGPADPAGKAAGTPADEAAAKPADEAAGKAPAGEGSADEAPADETPGDEAPGDQVADDRPTATATATDATVDADADADERRADGGADGGARGAERDGEDAEDASQTMTFRIPGTPAARIGRPPTAEEAEAAAAPVSPRRPSPEPPASEESGPTAKAPGEAGKPRSVPGPKAEDVSATTPFPVQQAPKKTEPTSQPSGSDAPEPAKGRPGSPEDTQAAAFRQDADAREDAKAPAKPAALRQGPKTPTIPAAPEQGTKAPTAPAAPEQGTKTPTAPAAPEQGTKARKTSSTPEQTTEALKVPTGLTHGSEPPKAPTALTQGSELPKAPTAPEQGAAPAQAPEAPAAPQAGKAAGKPMGLGARLLASAPKWLPVLLVLEGLIMYVLAVKAPPGPYWGVDPEDINGLGLIAALPATAFAAILIMIVSFFVTVAQSTDRKFLLLFQIAAITFALHGVGALVAEEPRFPTAYIHAGFVEFIGRTGETAIGIDARMGWPGFFALFAFVTKAAGIDDLTPILNWSPLLSNLLYLLPFVLILRQVVATTRARWFAALLFILVQWIGQDYFSPQGFTFALYLAFVAILLRWFGRVEPRTKPIPPKGLRRLLARLDAMTPGELANTGMFRADKLLMLMLLLALFVASTASHQITPFMMLGVLTAFLLFKRTSLTWGLPFFLGLVVLTWISYMAVGFWVGQIDTIFGGLGRVFDNLQTNTGDRIEGSDPLHSLVLQARLGILVVILALAAVGLYRRLHRGVFDRAGLILLCVPALALAMQSYGGEMGLRIYMFALPGACLLAAYAFFPNMPADSADVREETVPIRKRNVRFNPDLTRKISLVLAACIAVGLAGAFLVARYGNEKFERVTSGEVAAMHYVYEHDKPSARVVYLVPKLGPEVTPTLPWGERDIELVNFAGQAQVFKDPSNITGVLDRLRPSPDNPRNTYVVVSRGQVSYLQLNEGFPEGWGEKFRASLDAAPELKRVFANDDAALYTWGKFVRGTEIPDPRPYESGRGDPTSPWTPVGIGALAVTWITLFSYEVIRLNGPRRAPRARRWLLGVAIPAFLVALGVIIERFVYIAGLN
ncbi:hypothetical protein [Nonomuraea sp. NPDC048826]|uniref:hypothetical protein n=1 Tax=Nonomuraea sp. NPDC048826 TaxID=3364347 RepID=UPI003717442D